MRVGKVKCKLQAICTVATGLICLIDLSFVSQISRFPSIIGVVCTCTGSCVPFDVCGCVPFDLCSCVSLGVLGKFP